MSQNEYMAEVIETASKLGYHVLEMDARGHVRLMPKLRGNPDDTISIDGLFTLDLMRRCLKPLEEPA